MGNQNKTERNVEISREDDSQYIINLDEIVEQWVWNKTKTKLSSRFKREDLLITINWKRVLFTQNKVYLHNSSSSCKSRRLLRTNFENKTPTTQSHTFATERSTCSLFKFMFTHKLYKSQESTINFQLPVNAGIRHEQCIQFGQDTIKEYEIPWKVNSQIHVPSRTRTTAELNIDEEEFQSDFSVSIRFSGRIRATVAAHRLPDTYLKSINGDIVQIISEAMKSNNRLRTYFEILEGSSPSICFTMRGKCSFRYGIKQNVILNQETLSSSMDLNFIPSAPSEYCHLITSGS